MRSSFFMIRLVYQLCGAPSNHLLTIGIEIKGEIRDKRDTYLFL